MSSVISSQRVILTTAMAVSGAVLLLSLCRIWSFSPTHHDSDSDSQSSDHNSSYPLRSCLYSAEAKKKEKHKKKRVKFADNVKDEKRGINNEIGKKNGKVQNFRHEEIPEFRRMPANRAALYHGILRDRVNRLEYSY